MKFAALTIVTRKARLLSFIVIIMSCLQASLISAQQWQSFNTYATFDVNAVNILGPGVIVLGGGEESIDTIQVMFRSNDYGISWQENPYDGIGNSNNSIAFSDTTNGLGVGYHGRIIRTNDGGLNWIYSASPINRDFNKIVCVDSLSYFVVGGKQSNDSIQTILKTSDAGATWNVLYDTAGPWLKSVFFINALKGFAVGDSGVILSTTNGGNTWSHLLPPIQRNFNSIVFINADTGFIVGGITGRRTILRTDNGGTSWSVISDTSGGILNDISFADTSVAYVVGDSATVLKTTDGGYTWISVLISNNLTGSEIFSTVKFRDRNFGVIGGKAGLLYVYTGWRVDIFALGSEVIDSTTADVFGSVSTQGFLGNFYFTYNSDSTFHLMGMSTISQSVTANTFLPIHQRIYGLTPNTWYYYFVSNGAKNSDTLRFFTGIITNLFQTDNAANITDTTAILNGTVNKFSDSVNLFFEYGVTPLLGSQITAIPSSVHDTLNYHISVPLTALQKGTIYYFRMKGVNASGTYYGDIRCFFAGKVYSAFETLPAFVNYDTTVSFNGVVQGFKFPVNLSFEYGTTLSMNQQTDVTQYNDTSFFNVWGEAIGLSRNTLYYFRMKGETGLGIIYGNTLTFYTGGGDQGFNTLLASAITPTSARLNGQVDKLLFPTSLSFEYGTSRNLGNVITANPIFVNDTLHHQVSASVSGLVPNTIYYYRLKGTVSSDTSFYGDFKQLYTADCEIPNCDFEAWDTTSTEIPKGWSFLGDIHRVPSYNGSNAAEFRGGSVNHMGAIISGSVSGNNIGGFPFAARPDSISFYARYNIMAGDTGFVAVFFSLNGTLINKQLFPVTGSSGGNFLHKKYKINFPTSDVPDTLSIICMSGNGFSADPPSMSNPNSILAIDDISFTGTNLIVPNGNFEQWVTSAFDSPQAWYSNDEFVNTSIFDPVVKSSDRVSGNFAVQIQNNPAELRKCTYVKTWDNGLSMRPTFHVAARHNTLNGFVKYQPQNGDTLTLSAYMYLHGVIIGGAMLNIDTAIMNYTPFSIDIIYSDPMGTNIPDSACVMAEIGIFSPHGHSVAYIDNLSFDGFRAVDIKSPTASAVFRDILCKIYPDPAKNNLTVELNGFTGKVLYKVYDICGRNLLNSSENVDPSGTVIKTLNVSSLAAGTYLLNVLSDKTNVTRRFVVEK